VSTAIEVAQPSEIQQTEAAPTLEALVVRGMNDPSFDVDKLERLMALMERREVQQRKERFDSALAECQAKMPRITQHGVIDMGGKGKIGYAKLEDVDACIRPIYSAHGFSVRYDAPVNTDGKIRIVGHFSCAGHTESMEITFPPDSGPGRNAAQAVASSVAYGRRHLLKMFFNLIEEGADKNGAKTEDVTPITQDQADDIRTRMNDLRQSRDGILLEKLCRIYKVNRPEELRVSQLKAVMKDVSDTEARLRGAK